MTHRNNGLRGNRRITNAAYQWRVQLAKLPPADVTWSWSDVVGKSKAKCEHAAAYKMLRADYIIKHDEDVYETSEALQEYLGEHSIELEAWRAVVQDDTQGELVWMNGSVIAERSEGGCECFECGEEFGSAQGARSHSVQMHGSERACDAESKQAELTRWERVNEAVRVGKSDSEQTRLMV